MNPILTTVASSSFAAARKVDVLPDGHRCRRLHGHNFVASVFAQLPDGWASFPGGEVSEMRALVERKLEELNYRLLNEVIDQPTDENLARWVKRDLAIGCINRVAIQSTRDQGVDLDFAGRAHVWRRYRFQGAHWLPNVPPGHKCGRLHGHGFEVILHANQDLGAQDLSIDYDHIDRLWAPLQVQFENTCLNDIEGLANPTSEVLSSWLWARIKPELPELSWVTVFETASCGANYDGHEYRIWKDQTFDSAVQLRKAPADNSLSRVHGHTYKVRLHLCAPLDEVLGWTIDYGDVKAIFDPVYKSLDHHPLHRHPEFSDCSTQGIASWMFATVQERLASVYKLDLLETEGTGVQIGTLISGPTLPF